MRSNSTNQNIMHFKPVDLYLPELLIFVQGNNELQFLKEEVIVNQFLHNYHLPQTHPAASKEIWCCLFFKKSMYHRARVYSCKLSVQWQFLCSRSCVLIQQRRAEQVRLNSVHIQRVQMSQVQFLWRKATPQILGEPAHHLTFILNLILSVCTYVLWKVGVALDCNAPG